MFNRSVYSDYIFISKYARYLDKEKRRETWPETVGRYFNFIQEYLIENHNYDIKEIREELETAVLNHEIMPSMRALMTAGKAASKNHIAMYNCLAGDTLVTTFEYGIVPIKDVAGKKVHIVDGNGDWVLSECKSYGKDKLYKVNLASSGVGKISFRATADHRWIMKNGEELHTSDLKNGDRLANVSMPFRPYIIENSEDYKKGVIHGIIYGDGTATYKGKGTSSKELFTDKICNSFVIRLCGNSRELINYFEGYQRSYPNSYNGDPVVRINDVVLDLKSLPEEWVSHSYITGFIRGWFAADGSVTKQTHQVTLASNKEGLDWIYKYGPRYGFVPIHNDIYPSETNYGTRKEDLYRIEFDRRWLLEDDFLLQYKKDNFVTVERMIGKVISVEEDEVEEVFCFDVPTTHSFLLTKNILTGNCAYYPIDDFKMFDESMAISMSGTGDGFSVESNYVKELPEIPEEFFESDTTIVFHDSRLGWAKGFREFISLLLIGQIPKYDVSHLRPSGARLKTMGGRSSGPEPLVELLEFTINTFKKACGRKLTTLEVHDLNCKVGDIVVVGGVRRNAKISLSDLHDDKLRFAKSGNWYQTAGYRRLANNSAVYEEKPDAGVFLREWLALYDSKSGERGIISRAAIKNVIRNSNNFRKSLGLPTIRYRDISHFFGLNPCGEIILRPFQFCNLTSVQIYSDDTPESIKRKVKLSTILGTFQACFTDFKYINKKWKKNCEDERLLGVSLNGIYGNQYTNGRFFNAYGDMREISINNSYNVMTEFLEDLKTTAIETNIEWAALLGINSATAITCIKPEGTTSQFCTIPSGIHPFYSPFYIRYVRQDLKDPLTQFMIDAGFPYEKDVYDSNNVLCFKFPIKTEAGVICRKDISAIEHLELWKIYQEHYCEHKPSVTISIKESEWLSVGAWVYDNFDWMSGVSFLPAEEKNTIYKQAPYTECDETAYEALLAKMPKNVNWSDLKLYELEDATTNSREFACVGGGCSV